MTAEARASIIAAIGGLGASLPPFRFPASQDILKADPRASSFLKTNRLPRPNDDRVHRRRLDLFRHDGRVHLRDLQGRASRPPERTGRRSPEGLSREVRGTVPRQGVPPDDGEVVRIGHEVDRLKSLPFMMGRGGKLGIEE